MLRVLVLRLLMVHVPLPSRAVRHLPRPTDLLFRDAETVAAPRPDVYSSD